MCNVCKRQTLEIKLKQGPRALLLPLLVFFFFFFKEKRDAASAQSCAMKHKLREMHRLLGSLRHPLPFPLRE